MADKYDKSAAQILLRYQIDRGHIVIPKSFNKERIAANLEIFDFELSEEDVADINSLHCNIRQFPFAE